MQVYKHAAKTFPDTLMRWQHHTHILRGEVYYLNKTSTRSSTTIKLLQHELYIQSAFWYQPRPRSKITEPKIKLVIIHRQNDAMAHVPCEAAPAREAAANQ